MEFQQKLQQRQHSQQFLCRDQTWNWSLHYSIPNLNWVQNGLRIGIGIGFVGCLHWINPWVIDTRESRVKKN
ncbi:hypothetical protein RchiOBHm_Chr6g0312611 [Rosa chinensis]|uniref:Uncharacterized protein n=1 Tax=Rosa chinensis TaxID=74649 RepID=A0A2P6Q1Q4_ROSCH|nr:hypothetical protein RchiOBHm_Chr6g0312611 [Rosa chinensis]